MLLKSIKYGWKLGIPFISPHPRSKLGDGFVSKYFNRWISNPATSLILRSSLTPNQVSLGIALLVIPILIAGVNGHILIVAILWQFLSILDGIDGEIARAKNLTTRFGKLLDTILDYIVDSLATLALGLAVLVQYNISSAVIIFVVSITISTRLLRFKYCNAFTDFNNDSDVLYFK